MREAKMVWKRKNGGGKNGGGENGGGEIGREEKMGGGKGKEEIVGEMREGGKEWWEESR